MSRITRSQRDKILSKALEYHNFVYTSGVVPRNPSGDITAQSHDVLEQIDSLLELHGTDKTRLLQAQIWLKSISDRAAFNTVWAAWLPAEGAPARACVQAVLADPGWLVEVMVTACR